MRGLILSLVWPLVLLGSACAGAPPPKPASAAPVTTVAAKDGLVCTMETAVGTHMQKRVCTTAAEREAAREGAQAAMQKGQRRADRVTSSSSEPRL